MKNYLFLSVLAFSLCYCSKPKPDTPVTGNDTTNGTGSGTNNPPVVTPTAIVKGISYDSLKVLTIGGNSWNFTRMDSLFVSGYANLNTKAYLKYLGWDTIRRSDTTLYDIIYTDTSEEKITVLPNRVMLRDLPWNVNLASIKETDPSITDTSLLSIWEVKNLTRNRLDSQFVYLSPRVLWLFSPKNEQSDIKPLGAGLLYPLPQSGAGASTYHTNYYARSDTSFVINGKSFGPGEYLSKLWIIYISGNGLTNIGGKGNFWLTSSKGIIGMELSSWSTGGPTSFVQLATHRQLHD